MPLAGKTVLLHAEQGFGDTLQFIRYAPLLKSRGARVICEVQPELTSLLASLDGIEIVAMGDALPQFDLQCPLLSLPLAFGTELATIPAQMPYLAAPAARLAHWRERLGEGGPRAGFVWSGSPAHKNDANRSIPLSRFGSLFAELPFSCFSLQREMREADREALPRLPKLIDLGPELADFADTAAVISLLDVIVSVDTAVAHLAGALGKPVLILLRGDDQLNEAKLAGTLGTATFRAAEAEEIFKALGAHPGSLGAVGVSGHAVYADERLRDSAGMTTGANEDGFHLRNVAIARDIPVKQWADLRLVRAGEPCPTCGKELKLQRAIEVGHVFKLGTKYSVALKALFLDESGKQQPSIMGCYGIGVTRTLQAVIEQSHDDNGIVWPISVAPYTVCITPLTVTPESEVMKRAEMIYSDLTSRGIDVILDDRNDRPGVKFKDSELVGFPIRIGIGEKSLAKGEVELKPRAGALLGVKADEVVEKVIELIKQSR